MVCRRTVQGVESGCLGGPERGQWPGVRVESPPQLAGLLWCYGGPLACWQHSGWLAGSLSPAPGVIQRAAHQGSPKAALGGYLKLSEPEKDCCPLVGWSAAEAELSQVVGPVEAATAGT